MNDTERAQWIANDEGLYNWQRSSRQPMQQFIRDNRAEIDAAIVRAGGRIDTPRLRRRCDLRTMTGRAGQSLIPRFY